MGRVGFARTAGQIGIVFAHAPYPLAGVRFAEQVVWFIETKARASQWLSIDDFPEISATTTRRGNKLLTLLQSLSAR